MPEALQMYNDVLTPISVDCVFAIEKNKQGGLFARIAKKLAGISQNKITPKLLI